jgi:hypothetical protein
MDEVRASNRGRLKFGVVVVKRPASSLKGAQTRNSLNWLREKH